MSRRIVDVLFGERPRPAGGDALPLARWYLDQARLMEAMVVAKKGLEAVPGDRDLRLVLARVFMAKGKRRRAREELELLLEHAPGDEEARCLLERLG